MQSIAEHDFYQCIRWIVYLQRLGGGWIRRNKSERSRKCEYYSLEIYCILCTAITCGASIRALFFFNGDFSVETGNLFAYLMIIFYVVSGITQITSNLTSHEILPFWDSTLSVIPQKLNTKLTRAKIVIPCILCFGVCFIIAETTIAFYFILRPHPDTVFLLMAEPWTHTWTHTRISFMVTHACFLPALAIWLSSAMFLMTGGYYLRSGFIDLHNAMQDDQEMISHLSIYKHQHTRLSDLTSTLDRICKAYIGTVLAMATFDMCLVIFTLGDDRRGVVLFGSISLLCVTLNTLLIITVMSISINSWVMVLHLTRSVNRNDTVWIWCIYFKEIVKTMYIRHLCINLSERGIFGAYLVVSLIFHGCYTMKYGKLDKFTNYTISSLPVCFTFFRSPRSSHPNLDHMSVNQCIDFRNIFG